MVRAPTQDNRKREETDQVTILELCYNAETAACGSLSKCALRLCVVIVVNSRVNATMALRLSLLMLPSA